MKRMILFFLFLIFSFSLVIADGVADVVMLEDTENYCNYKNHIDGRTAEIEKYVLRNRLETKCRECSLLEDKFRRLRGKYLDLHEKPPLLNEEFRKETPKDFLDDDWLMRLLILGAGIGIGILIF